MSTRTAVTVVGGIVGAYFGYPQLGLVVGSLVGGAIDPTRIEGPQINETGAQTSAEGVQRPIIWGTIDVTGNIIHKGPSVKSTTEESQGKGGGPETTVNHLHRSYAIRICEGPIAAILRIWADNKLVFDNRVGSQMQSESDKWIENKVIYLGDESQLPDPTLVAIDEDTPSHRGTAYIVFILEDLTDRAGSIPQYRFEVAKEVEGVVGSAHIGPSNTGYVTDIYVDNVGNVMMLRDQTGGSPAFGIGYPGGTYTIATYNKNSINTLVDSEVFVNAGDFLDPGSDQRSGIIGIGPEGRQVTGGGLGTNAQYRRVFMNGAVVAHLVDENGATNWTQNEAGGGTPAIFGGGIYFHEGYIYQGVNRSGGTKLIKHSLYASGGTAGPAAYLNNAIGTTGFYMHVSRAGIVRIMSVADYVSMHDYNLSFGSIGSWTAPTYTGSALGFGADDDKDLFIRVDLVSATIWVRIYSLSTLSLITQHSFVGVTITDTPAVKVLFTDENIFVKVYRTVLSIDTPTTKQGIPALLSDIVSDIYKRCGVDESMFDVSELTDEVAGLVCANAYTGADAISKLIQGYWFDISGHDSKNWHPKRGAAVIETLTIDDLLEIPDTNTREQAIERPKKLHLRYKHAASGYAAVKATAPRANSPDVLTTGEAIIELPIVLDENQAARKADVMYKIASTEVAGETQIVVPFRVGAKYVNGNAVGLSLRGMTNRWRVDRIEYQPWRIKLILKPDRQSAYTSNLTGVPIPPPELPPSTLVGETEMAILDISARVDSEDDLNYLVAVSGISPAWYGARYQRSFDTGATYATVQDIRTASVMGELLSDIPIMSEHFTDETSVINVMLYRDSQTLESISESQFQSEGNPCAIEKEDGSWELMQFRDVERNSDGSFSCTTLHRGRLSSGTSAHSSGARFVMLQRPSHIDAQAAWIGLDITHRAISLGESADDTDNDYTQEFVGRSQREWAPAYLEVDSSTLSAISASWVGRGRFGDAFNPVMSRNFNNYRVTLDNVVQTITVDTTAESISSLDGSSMAQPFVFRVAGVNRLTGEGDASTVVIGGTAPAPSYRPSGAISSTVYPVFAHQAGSTIVVQETNLAGTAAYMAFYDMNLTLIARSGGTNGARGCCSIGNISYFLLDTGLGNSQIQRFDRTSSYSTPTHTVNFTTPITDIVACGSDLWVADPSQTVGLIKLNPADLTVLNYCPTTYGPRVLASDGTLVYATGTGMNVIYVVTDPSTVSSIPLPLTYSVVDMEYAAGKLIVSQDAVRAVNPANGNVLRVLLDDVTDTRLSVAGNALVLFRGNAGPPLVLQAADLEVSAEVITTDQVVGAHALNENLLLIGTTTGSAVSEELYIP